MAQANATHITQSKISRRAILGTAAACALPTTVAASSSQTHPDARLIELGRQLDAFVESVTTLFRKLDAHNPRPVAIYWKPEDKVLGFDRPDNDSGVYTQCDVDQMRRWVGIGRRAARGGNQVICDAQRDRAKEIIFSYDQWGSRESADPGIGAEIDRLYEAAGPLEEEIISTRATTIDGLIIKTRLVNWCRDGELDEHEDTTVDLRATWSLLRDLRALDPHGAAAA